MCFLLRTNKNVEHLLYIHYQEKRTFSSMGQLDKGNCEVFTSPKNPLPRKILGLQHCCFVYSVCRTLKFYFSKNQVLSNKLPMPKKKKFKHKKNL